LAIGIPTVAAMPKSLLEQLPEIVARGRQQAEKILEGLEGRHRVVRKKDAGIGDAENAAIEREAVKDGYLVAESFRGGVVR
jgi:hypothetical protein